MLSRVADAIYWSSRYVERAENVARFVDVSFGALLETPVAQRTSWEPLVLTTGDQEWFWAHYDAATPEKVAWFLTFDTDYPNSVLSSLKSARENAQTVREVISREMWQQLNATYMMVRDAKREGVPLEEMGALLDQVKVSGIHFEGVTNATLSRGEAWHFSRMGRLLERADKVSRIVDVKYFTLLPSSIEIGTAIDQLGWAALLDSASALQMYRQLYHITTPQNVARFLLLNDAFPRSMLYCIGEVQHSLHAITGTPMHSARLECERLLGQLRAELGYSRVEDIFERGLHETIDALQVRMNHVGQALTQHFFALE